MITYDPALVAQLAAEIASAHWLLEVQFTSATQRWCDADVTLLYSGQLFIPRALKIGNIQRSSGFRVDQVAVEVGNVDRALSAILMGEDVVGRTAILRVMALDVARQEIGTAEVFRGFIVGWGDLTETRVPINLGNEFLMWQKKTLRLPGPSCPWVFKGVGGECAYTGGEIWCDQSPERCAAIGNYDNFGGRKYIAAIESMRIYWGPAGT